MPESQAANETASQTAAETELLTGTVVRASGAIYEVDVLCDAADEVSGQDGPHGPVANRGGRDDTPVRHESLACTLRGTLKRGRRAAAQPVSVGDQVRVRPLAGHGPDARGRRLQEGYIETVLPRRSILGRARYNKTAQVTVANLDQVVIVMSLREPELNTHRLDRFLVLAEAHDLRSVICFNKCDMLSKREFKQEVVPLLKLYSGLGYAAMATSAETDLGIEEARAALAGHITAVLGSSGVGKSSLVNAIQPGLRLWVGDVMDIGKGRHTTTEVSLHPLDHGGYIADTPGIKTITLLEQDEVNLPYCFPEFLPHLGQCRFNDCSHVTEPDCAVRAAVAAGAIAAPRYDSYVKMLQDTTLRTPGYSRGRIRSTAR